MRPSTVNTKLIEKEGAVKMTKLSTLSLESQAWPKSDQDAHVSLVA